MMSKQDKYNHLVSLRKQCNLCKDLYNPFLVENGSFDSREIGPWTQWQGNLDSDLMLIAQDWGCLDNFVKYKGKDINSGTNKALKTLFRLIGLNLTLPLDIDNINSYIFTNTVLCLKKGDDQAKINKEWCRNCGQRFLRPLIEIVMPRVVICMGQWAFNTVMACYGKKPILFNIAVNSHVPFNLDNNIAIFPVYHCGAQGVNRNRSKKDQFEDWYYIREWLALNKDN